jgi:tetratricopeptide (TPR) repeat protein
MKIIYLLISIFILFSTNSIAQKTKVQTAWNYLKYDELDRAKEAIDEASKNETSMNMDKTWYYRGMIYQNLYKHPKFGNLVSNPLQEALTSYNKALELDPKSENTEDILKRKELLAGQLGEQGAVQFKNGMYADALNSFETILKINPSDSSVVFNCAIAADKAGDKEKAKIYYTKLIDSRYNDVKIYNLLAAIYKSEKDDAKAYEIVQKGRKFFPEDNGLMIEELNYYLANGKSAEAIESLEKAVQADPNNASLFLAQGNLLDKAGQQEKAAEAYKQAILLKPDYFDAYYNLGAMFFNQGAEMANKANDIPPKEIQKYEDAKKKFEAKFKEAEPYLEKAWELNPKDNGTMTSLKQIYMRTGETEKFNKVKAALETNK